MCVLGKTAALAVCSSVIAQIIVDILQVVTQMSEYSTVHISLLVFPFLGQSADHKFEMTYRLKIAAKLTHPTLGAAPLWPDKRPQDRGALHPVMKCKLFPAVHSTRTEEPTPLQIREQGARYCLPPNKGSQQIRSEWLPTNVLWVSWRRKLLLLLCHQVGAPQGSILGLLFGLLPLCCDCVCMCAHVWALRLLSGRSGEPL